MAGEENDWDLAVGISQPSLQLDATHPWQTHVEDQTHRVLPLGRVEVVFRRGKRLCQKACSLHDAPQRLAKGFIIINNGDNTGLTLNVVPLYSSDLPLDKTPDNTETNNLGASKAILL